MFLQGYTSTRLRNIFTGLHDTDCQSDEDNLISLDIDVLVNIYRNFWYRCSYIIHY